MIVPIPITVRPHALTAWRFEHVDQGPEFAELVRGEWQPNDRVPGVSFCFYEGKHRWRLTVGDYLVRDGASNFRVVMPVNFEGTYDTVVPQHPASLLARVRLLLTEHETDYGPDAVFVEGLRKLLGVRHDIDECGGCGHIRFVHRGLHGVYQDCALCRSEGGSCAGYVETVDESV